MSVDVAVPPCVDGFSVRSCVARSTATRPNWARQPSHHSNLPSSDQCLYEVCPPRGALRDEASHAPMIACLTVHLSVGYLHSQLSYGRRASAKLP
jgi:hypothetical protein